MENHKGIHCFQSAALIAVLLRLHEYKLPKTQTAAEKKHEEEEYEEGI